jgi:Ser/Thr protein kinase RdoA (MazF antagonist)
VPDRAVQSAILTVIHGGRYTCLTWATTTAATSKDVPEPRVCSVLRWMDGRVHTAAPRPVHLRRLGSVMARLHNHAGQWRLPFGLWFTGTVQANPAFRADLDQVLGNIGRSLDALLGD